MLCMDATMAELLAVPTLRQMMEEGLDSASNVLLIDCRPFILFNSGRISNAHNVHCPPIVKRRSGGCIPLENIVRCPNARKSLREGHFQYVVVYDQQTYHLTDISDDSTVYLVIKTLTEEIGGRVHFLQGGYQSFQSMCPHLCVRPVGLGMTSPPASTQFVMRSDTQGFPPIRHPPSQCIATCDQNGPVEVLPWLYIGNVQHAVHAEQLRQLGITALLNMAATCETYALPNGLIYKYIPVRDSCTADILQWFPSAIEFIESVRQQSGKVLVHCKAGISRSATICIAYLMQHKQLNLDDAFDFLKSKRGLISPNLNFMRQLSEFEVQLKKARETSLALRRGLPKGLTLNLDSLLGEKALQCRPSQVYGPCTKQAFVFDMPLTPTTTCSPTLPICASPLLSSPS